MLEIVNSGATVDLTVVTLNFRKNTGGKRIKLKQCVRAGSNHSTKKNGTITFKEARRYDHPITVHITAIEEINGLTVL